LFLHPVKTEVKRRTAVIDAQPIILKINFFICILLFCFDSIL
jgi:hypothetical protein